MNDSDATDVVKELHDSISQKCYVEGDAIILRVRGGGEYPVHFSRCSTPEALLGWVYHLGEKNWMTASLMRRFVFHASKHHGFELHGHF